MPLIILLVACINLIAGTQFSHADDYTLLQTREHNRNIFTQGLQLHDGYFYESSGHFGRSRLYRYPAKASSGNWLVRTLSKSSRGESRKLDPHIFAEGLTILDNTLYLLSWKAGRAFSFNAETLAPTQEFRFAGEGWGLTNNGRELIRSDGSDYLFFHDPSDFSVSKRLWVKGFGRSWGNINELEYVKGVLWANIWQENIVIAINPDTGDVLQIVDLSKLVELENNHSHDAVLNGIAYDSERDALWVTGKLWDHMYLISVRNKTAVKTEVSLVVFDELPQNRGSITSTR